MSLLRMKQAPLRMDARNKREVRTQFAALCYRVHKEKTQILLVTSRQRGRWIIPKGWPEDGATPAQTAATEAFEEAGVEGKSFNICLGFYSYTKLMGDQPNLACAVSVFPVRVKKLLKVYPEMDQRRRKWFSHKKAVEKVREPELRKILKHFDPALLEK